MKTSDFYLAAYLLDKGFELQGSDRSNPKRIFFHFDSGENEAIVFFNKEAVVEPISFSMSIKYLKKELYKYDKD